MADTIEIIQGTATVVEVAGPTGPQGPSGSVGATGATGPAGPAGTGIETLTTKGDLLSRNDSAAIRVGIGSTGQVLKVSAQGLPTWANESGAVTSVNGQTGAVTVADAQHAEEHEAGEADEIKAMAALVATDVNALNGVYFFDGTTTGGRPNFFKTGTRKNTKLEYNTGNSQWKLIRNNVVEAVGVDGPNTVPWGHTWEELVTPTSVSVTRLPLETMVQKLAETGGAATATTSEDGLMSSSDKTKLNGIASGAEVNVQANWTEADSGSDAFILNKPSTFAPTAHAASHAAGTKAQFSSQVAGMTQDVTIRANNVGTAGNSITLSFTGGTKGTFTGQVAGMTTNVTIQALNNGSGGNVTLPFDGVITIQDAIDGDATVELVSGNGTQVPDDGEEIVLTGGGGTIQDVLSAWNAANPSNQATLISGDGSQAPNNGASITLSGGAAGGSDPFKNINQDLGTTDSPQFVGLVINGTNTGGGDIRLRGKTFFGTADGSTGVLVESTNTFPANTFGFTGVNQAVTAYRALGFTSDGSEQLYLNTDGNVGVGNTDPSAKLDVAGNAVLRDVTNSFKATFDADDKLSANRIYDLPDRSGELMIVGDAPSSHTHGNLTNDGKLGSTAGLPVVTTTAGAVTTLALGTANQVLRVNSGATGVEFADPAAAGVTSVTGTAPIVSSGGTTPAISISAATTSADGSMSAADKTKLDGIAAGATANSSDATLLNRANHTGTQAASTITGLAASATTDTTNASNISSGTLAPARMGSGTPSASNYLRGDGSWQTVAAGGVTSGSVDNAVLRADGVGGSTSQSSDINILDATTSTQNNVAITNEHSGQTNSSLVLGTKGTGAFIVSPARPDGAATGGNARGASAICIQTGARSANTNVASGADSIAIGRNSRATPAGGIAIGNGAYTAAGGAVVIGNNSGLDGNDSVAVGASAYAAARGTSLGFFAGYSTYGADAVIIGHQASTSGVYACAIGSLVTGGSLRSGFFTRPFNAIYWSGQTTTNAATVLNLDGTATNRFTIAASTALAVDILLVARRATTQDKWLVARRFLGIRRDGSNNTALIGAVQTLGTDQSAGSPTWTFALTADDTNEALQLEVTGATGETVEWRATAFYRVA